jgi:hypothetical protein
MNSKITELTNRIASLEQQLLDELEKNQQKFSYTLEGTRVRFTEEIQQAHRKLKQAVLPWLFSSRMRSILSAPFIYSMIVPIAFFDLTITLYQHICFRLYHIRLVKRSDYIVLDRHQLGYLNAIEKLNCIYCGYGNGVVAYTREVIARTEQYWCPIKHARKAVGRHARYRAFSEYGDGEHYKEQLLKLRDELKPDRTE